VRKTFFLIAGACLYIDAIAMIALMYYLMPAGSTFPVILIVVPAIPMLWLGSICLRRGGASSGLMFRWK